MSVIEEHILVIGSVQGCLLFLLLFSDPRSSTASRILGVLCLVMVSALTMPFLRLAESEFAVAAAGWVFFVPASAGSLAYLYCRSALLGATLKPQDLVLFLPWFACYLLSIDYLLGDPKPLLRWINGGQADDWRLPLTEILIFLQGFTFAGVTAHRIWHYRRQADDVLSDFNPATFNWLMALQIFTIVVWTLNAIPSFTNAPATFSQVANLLMVVMIYTIAILQWRQPRLFTVDQLSNEEAAEAATPSLAAASPGSNDAALLASVFASIETTVETEALFLDSQLTLSDLAAATGLTRHQVSEALNRHAGINFYEFINGYRVAAVCQRLADDSSETLLNIALACGFSSKSTFNAIFKQLTGQTPSDYRRGLASDNVRAGQLGRPN